MSIFDFFRRQDINKGVEDFRAAPNAVLLDVRTPEEYFAGHIPQSRNIPLPAIKRVAEVIKDKDTPIYVYCLSGGRSSRAVDILKNSGYNRVNDIGGISAYRGKLESA